MSHDAKIARNDEMAKENAKKVLSREIIYA